MGDMTKQAKETNEIGKLNNKAEELTALSTEAFELALGIENFLIGQTPSAASEKQDKPQPTGWYQAYWDRLHEVGNKLNLVIKSLRAVRSASE